MKLKEFVDMYNGDFDVKGYGNEEYLLSNISSMDYFNGELYRQFDDIKIITIMLNLSGRLIVLI